MKTRIIISLILLVFSLQTQAQEVNFDVRGFCIAAPKSKGLPDFLKFIEKELAPRKVNTLLLRVDFNYQYKSRPELRDEDALSETEVKQLVELCKKYEINLIPQINLLGHQSWAETTYNLLVKYPEFDETPHVKMPKEYEWPNEDGLYCKSYCPLHLEVHAVVFDLVDEIMDVFEAKDFHAGMDEVFYIGDDKCPRCSGKDKAELFAGEVTKIRNHLALKDRKLWIWGDRLLDGKTTGLGMWEASMNNTHRAIDLIPKDVVICDWHYERPEPTAAYFAMKGFQVITCPWNKPEVARKQTSDLKTLKLHSNKTLAEKYLGMMQTVWSGSESFMEVYYGEVEASERRKGPSECFKALFEELNKE